MRRKLRSEQVLKRKNFLPTLLTTIGLWALLGILIYFVEPNFFGAILIFFVTTFFSLLFTSALIFGSSRRGLLASVSITLFLILRYLGVGNFLNFILIVAIAACIEIYFETK